MIRIGVIGLGAMTRTVHLPLLERLRDTFEIAALVDVSQASLAAAHRESIPQFREVSSLLAAVTRGEIAVDGALIATSGSHVSPVIELLDAGIPVLSEKPLAYTRKEIAQLHAAARAWAGRPEDMLRIGYMKEYDPAVHAAVQELAGREIRAINIEVLHPADEKQLRFARLGPRPAGRPHPDFDRVLDGAINGALRDAPPALRHLYPNILLGSVIHDIALMRHLGFPLSVADARYLPEPEPTVIAHGASHSVPWHLGWHFIADYPEYLERLTFHHATGSIEILFRTPYILHAPTELRLRSESERASSLEVRTWPQEEAFINEFLSFAELIRGQPVPGSSLSEAADDLAVAEAMWSRCRTAHISTDRCTHPGESS